MSDESRNGFQKKVLVLECVTHGFWVLGFGVYIYLLQFLLISRSSYVSSLHRWRLTTVLNSKGRDESSIPHIGRLYRLHSSREAQSRFRRPGRTRTRDTGRTCVSSTRRLLAAAAAAAASMPVTPHVPLPSSTCVRPVLPSLLLS